MTMSFRSTRVFGLIWLVLVTTSVFAQSDRERAEVLFQEGYTLYQQLLRPVAITPLEKAANLGHVEAAYWVGEILRKRYTYITTEAEQFYRQAADGGEIYAMLRFAQTGKMCSTLRNCDYNRKEWLDRAMATALPKAEAGDLNAMKDVYSIYRVAGDTGEAWEWIQMAAKGGHVFSQYWVAILLEEQSMGFYWTDEGRRQDILKWLRASAEQGFAKAILKLALELKEDGRFEEANQWVDRMGSTDYYDALVNYSLILLQGPDGMFRYPESKPVEGLAMLFALHRQMGKSEVRELIEQYKTDLNDRDVAKAEKRSEELLVDTPIIYYLPKFGM